MRSWKVSRMPRFALVLVLSLALALGGPLAVPAATAAPAPFVSILSPQNGDAASGGIVEVSGAYAGVYDVRLYINGVRQTAVAMDDPDGDDAGTWSYPLDVSRYDGGIELTARGLDVATRYGVWSGKVTLQVNNAAAAAPEVVIVSPEEGVPLTGKVRVKVSVSSASPVTGVQVRVNRGPWMDAKFDGTNYEYKWKTKGLGDRTVSLEARASNGPGRFGYSPTVYAQVGAGTKEPFVMPHQDRAMWIWEPESYRLLLNPGSRAVLEDFITDTETFGSDAVTTLYLAVGSFAGYRALEEQEEELKSFIRWAHERGLQVHALIAGGTSPAYMGAYERYHHHAVREMEQIVNYNLAAEADEKFDGINVDIEPYISPDFKDASKFLQGEYLDGLAKMIERRDAAGINLPFGPAIPKWYNSSAQGESITWNGETKWLSEHIQDISDYISIMDYRDSADGSAGIIAGAAGEIAYAALIGKPDSVVIGVETLDIANSGDPETISFWEEGRTHMEAELDKVYAAFGEDSTFGGIAVHHYDSYRLLPSYWGEGGTAWSPPADGEAPTAVSSGPAALAADYQTVNLSYGMAGDNGEIDRYIVYRSTVPDFAPTADTIAGLSRSLTYQDKGLLPTTTYYYKVAARDLAGHIGPVSSEVAVTTGDTELKPLIVKEMNIAYTGSSASASMTVSDYETGEVLAGAAVEGRFTYSGGRYVTGVTGAAGTVLFTSEAIASGRQVGFEPRRIALSGYYFASAHDEPHATALTPREGLSGLATDTGTWSAAFAKERTSYTVTVPASVGELQVTPTAAEASSVVKVNGVISPGGSAPVTVAIGSGPQVVSVLVYNADGTTDVYLLRIERSGGEELTVPVSRDAYVYEHEPTGNFGEAQLLEVADIPNASGGGDRIAFMGANVSAIADPVVLARLFVYVPEAPSKAVTLSLRGYSGAQWEEGAVNWSNRPVAGGTALGTIRVTEAGWYAADVTAFVAGIAASGGQATFQWTEPNTAGVVIKLSSSESDEGQPYLQVNT
ncbi:CBM96 family carbohydrate-binding protein [Paenibacillus soyae]|uniref:DNRLRE domain-containing protein n=1 Tax=Paenibacillus soyae TaxID=2969249 RepID=A0A9X2MQY1_9BACL|nr:DNRLRE domain-containing protein [Paenibacillus soyae]MCR2805241.1 DNRLRE domain-containing protein [Paenibacillus soyae]